MPEPKKTKSKKEHPFKRLQTDLAVVIAGIEPGGKLPSEPELALKLGVSRATLREAMRAFEEQGLIRRRQGVGTFVVRHQQVIDAGVEVLESIESIAARMGLEVSMGLLISSTFPQITIRQPYLEKCQGPHSCVYPG